MARSCRHNELRNTTKTFYVFVGCNVLVCLSAPNVIEFTDKPLHNLSIVFSKLIYCGKTINSSSATIFPDRDVTLLEHRGKNANLVFSKLISLQNRSKLSGTEENNWDSYKISNCETTNAFINSIATTTKSVNNEEWKNMINGSNYNVNNLPNDELNITEPSQEPPYRFGERTEDLRKAILKFKQLGVMDSSLFKNEGRWCLRVDDNVKVVTMQGLTKNKFLGRSMLVRTEDGIWYKLVSVPQEFRNYIVHLPYQFDDLKFLSFDGKTLFLRNGYGENVKVHWKIRIGNKSMTVKDEDGRDYLISITPESNKFKEYVGALPIFEERLLTRQLNVVPLGKRAPTEGLRRALTLKYLRPIPLSDQNLTEENGVWYVTDSGKRNKIIAIGITMERYQRYVFAQAENGKWHIFLTVSPEFKTYISKLPVHVDMGRVCFDGKNCYIRGKVGDYVKIVKRGKVRDCAFNGDGDDGEHYSFYVFPKALDIFIQHFKTLPYINKLEWQYNSLKDRNQLWTLRNQTKLRNHNSSQSRTQYTYSQTDRLRQPRKFIPYIILTTLKP